MAASAYYHLFNCVNKQEYDRLVRFDYAGIACMIAGSATPPIYYGFMCQEMHFWQYLYLGQIWAFCITALLVVLIPEHVKSWQSSIAFLLAGYSTTPGLVHLSYYADNRYVPHNFMIWPWLTGGIIYAIGAIIYSVKFPER